MDEPFIAPVTPESITAFTDQLGVNEAEHAYFGWIAEVGLRSPLPPRFTCHADDDSGFLYYVDHDKQVSTWENPLVPHLRRIVEIGRTFLKQPTEGFFEEQKGILWHQHKHALSGWHGPFVDGEGRQYFVNAVEEVSSWQDPRVDAQYIFELESGLLASLEEILPQPHAGWAGHTWKTDNGADVLTLDGNNNFNNTFSSKASTGRLTSGWRRAGGSPTLQTFGETINLKTIAELSAKKNHISTLEEMGAAAKRAIAIRQEEDEIQRLAFARRVEERKKRRNQKGNVLERPPQLPPPPQLTASASPVPTGSGPPSPEHVAKNALRAKPMPMFLDDETCQETDIQPPPSIEFLSTGISVDGAGMNMLEKMPKPPALPPSPLAGSRPHLLPELGFSKSRCVSGGFRGSVFAKVDLGSCPDDQEHFAHRSPLKEGIECGGS